MIILFLKHNSIAVIQKIIASKSITVITAISDGINTSEHFPESTGSQK